MMRSLFFVFSHTYADNYSAEYSGEPLTNLQSILSLQLCPLHHFSDLQTLATLVCVDSQLCHLNLGSLLDSPWVSLPMLGPGNSEGVSWSNPRLNTLIPHHIVIAVLHCQMPNVLKIIVSYISSGYLVVSGGRINSIILFYFSQQSTFSQILYYGITSPSRCELHLPLSLHLPLLPCAQCPP